ncbi:phosphatase PAP2 family protein [Puia dinghuensis]|nr:phosphatase PAP2 family protein [Puia dinghuensis]
MKRLATVVICLGWICQMGKAQGIRTSGYGDTIREVSFRPVWGSTPDTVPHIDWHKGLTYKQPFPYQSFILPAAMIAYGATAVHNGTLQKVNADVKEQIWQDNPHSLFHLDNYLQFAPTLSVYALNAAGIHGAHNFKDRTIILVMANIIANGSVFTVKSWSHEQRPNGSDYLSFPSGHTAEAFVGAEFMRMEYKDVSPWYGVAGYAMATATGLLRVYNDAHWFSDVVAGAGFGIASTRLAYWLYPKVQHLFGKNTNPETVNVVMPTYNSGTFGLSYVKVF